MTTEKVFVAGDRYGNESALLARGPVVELATRVYDAAGDEDGIISAADMVELFPGQPELHTATRLQIALLAAGCEAIML